MESLRVVRLDSRARLPLRATAGAAGADLFALLDEPLMLRLGDRALVPTGIAAAISEGLVGLVFARSGLAIKHGLALSNGVGVIDSDYRGEIKVGLINQGAEPYTIQPFERIAQLVLVPAAALPIVEVDALDDTARGSGGFGSSGKQ